MLFQLRDRRPGLDRLLGLALLLAATGWPDLAHAQSWQSFIKDIIRTIPDNSTGQDQQQPPRPQQPPRESTVPPMAPRNFNGDARVVAKAQRLLGELGYDVGAADGLYGSRTRTAIVAFQSDHQLPGQGDVTRQLIAQLSTEVQRQPTGSNTYAQADRSHVGQGVGQGGDAQEQPLAPPAKAPASLPAEHVLAPSPQEGIRPLEPTMAGDRILSGYPLMYGKHASIKYGMQQADSIKPLFELALLSDLLILKQWPAIIDDKVAVHDGQDTKFSNEIALRYANRFLIGSTLRKYLAPCGVYGCNPDRRYPYSGWAGSNEFEREASYRAFLEDIRPLLIEMAPNLPIKFVHVVQVEVKAYDDKAGGFPIKNPRGKSGLMNSTQSGPSFGRLKLNGDHDVPALIKISRDKAPGLLSRLQGKNRTAYLAYDVTLDKPSWGTEYNEPTFETVWSTPQLYADVDLQQPLYRFEKSPSPEAATAKPAETPAKSLVPVNTFLLAYKLAPDAISQHGLVEREKTQIGQDQWHYNAHSKNKAAVFTEAQVKGRVIDFVAAELLPAYKQKIAALARQIPDQHLHIKDVVNFSYLEYQGGMVRQNSGHGMGPKILGGFQAVSADDALHNYPPLGAYQVMDGSPRLQAVMVPTPVLESLKNGISLDLATDRKLTVPPLPLDAATAEKAWKPVDCSMSAFYKKGMKTRAADAASRKCQQENRGYVQGFTLDFDISIEGTVKTKRALVLKARVNKVDIYGPHQVLLKTIPGTDLPPAEDVWAARDNAAAAREKAKQQEQAVAAEKKAALRTRLGSADIVGLNLGMSFSEATKFVRDHMPVEAVTEGLSSRMTSPFMDDMLGFFNANGQERMILVRSSAGSEKLVGIARGIKIQEGLTLQSFKDKLVAKYGPISNTKNFFDSAYNWTATIDKGFCLAHVDAPAYSLPVIEGAQPANEYSSRKTMHFLSSYALNRSSLAQMAKDCGPGVYATVTQSWLYVGIYDLGKYARDWVKGEKAKKAKETGATPDDTHL